MNKNEAAALFILELDCDGDVNAAAEVIGDVLDEENDHEAVKFCVAQLGDDETEIHESLKSISTHLIGNLAVLFADMYELCHEHSSDPEVCGCESAMCSDCDEPLTALGRCPNNCNA